MCHSSKHTLVNVCLMLYLCLVFLFFGCLTPPLWRGNLVSQPVEPKPSYPHLKRNAEWTTPAMKRTPDISRGPCCESRPKAPPSLTFTVPHLKDRRKGRLDWLSQERTAPLAAHKHRL